MGVELLMPTNHELHLRRSRRRQAGLTVVELMIASLLILVTVLGVLPLFYRSTINNAMGEDSTQLSNHAKSRLEEYSRLPFDAPELTIADGQETLQTIEYWNREEKRFTTDEPDEASIDGQNTRFVRTTTIRQYSLGDLEEDGDLDNPLPGGTASSVVQLKEIRVLVESFVREDDRDGWAGVPGRRILVQDIKTF